MVNAVIFDMDGLMFDTERLGKEAWLQIGTETGFAIDEAVLSRIRGTTPAASAQVFYEQFGEAFDYPVLKARRNQLVQERIDRDGLPVKKGLETLLRTLKHSHILCAVATSSPKATLLKYLSMANITDQFQAFVTAEDVTSSKPSPECFMKAAQKLGVPYRDCLVLEDSSNGIWAAQAAGMQAICIPDLPLQDEKALDHVAAVLSSLDEVCSWLFMSSHGQPVPEE